MKLNLDPRVEPMFRGRPPHERFLAVAMLAILGAVSKSGELLEAVLDQTKGTDVDWSELVGGKPLLHYNAKTRAQLLKENVPQKTIDLVAKALERRGMKLVDGDLPATESPAKAAAKPTVAKPAKKDATAPEEEEDEVPQHEQEPANGDLYAGKPLEFYFGLTRDQILAVEGINPPTADKILELLTVEKPKDESPPAAK